MEKGRGLFIFGIVILCLQGLGLIGYILARIFDPGGIAVGLILFVGLILIEEFFVSVIGIIISLIMFFKKNKRKFAIILFAVSFIIFATIAGIFIVLLKDSLDNVKEDREREIEEEAYALQRYEELKEELKEGQLVVGGLHESLFLERNITVNMDLWGKKEEEFPEKFIDEYLLGKKVLIILPEKEAFVKSYYLYDDEDERFEPKDVYYHGKSLNGLLNGTYTKEDFLINESNM